MRLLLAVMLLNILMVANVSSANGKAKGKLTTTGGTGGKEIILNGLTGSSLLQVYQ